MKKAIIKIILGAFTFGIVAETAVAVHSLATGQGVGVSDAIELVVCWGVVLAVFVTAIARSLNGGSVFGVAVWHRETPVEDDTPEEDEDTPEEDTEEETEEGEDTEEN